MDKEKLKHFIIAAILGAAVTFITRLLEYLTGIDGQIHQNIFGGTISTLYYIKKSLVDFV